MFKRFFRDMWIFIKAQPRIWKEIRILSKAEKEFIKMQKELGDLGTFLHHFESIPDGIENSKEIKKYVLEDFLQCIPQLGEINQEDLDSIHSYCKIYGVDIQEE